MAKTCKKMTKVRTFQRSFSKGHPKEFQPTFFVEKILNSIKVDYQSEWYYHRLMDFNTVNLSKGKLTYRDLESFWQSLKPCTESKHHTIRSGFHFKQNMNLSPRVWSGKPYDSPQIIFWRDIEIKRTQEFYRDASGNWLIDKSVIDEATRHQLAANDGLTHDDMAAWFNKEIHGQIICWSDKVSYF